MVTIWSQHYRSPSLGASEGRSSNLSHIKPMIALDKEFLPNLAWETATRYHIFNVGSFDNMEEETRERIRYQFFD